MCSKPMTAICTLAFHLAASWISQSHAFVSPVQVFGPRSLNSEGASLKSRQRTECWAKLENDVSEDRRSVFTKMAGVVIPTIALISSSFPKEADAAVGTLPEYEDTNAVVQGLTVTVADKSQQDAMIQFLVDSFDFKVLRQSVSGTITNTWLGFGPEQLSIPSDFEIPVSSFATYGGHASLCIQYDANSLSPTFKQGEDTSKSNVAYLQVGVPTYRISQMVKNGGDVLDAYGIVNVISPSGLPIRGIVGIRPDPMMFVAINCQNVKESAQFYQQLGFVPQPYPYARPGQGKGQFEPPQPDKSIYLAPSPNSMGVLLLQAKDKRKPVAANKSVKGVTLVYTPSEGASEDDFQLSDPSSVPIAFTSVSQFEQMEKATRVATSD